MKKTMITLCALIMMSWVAIAQSNNTVTNESETIAYVVPAGQTLYGLSVKYKNDGSKWKEIFDLNPQVAARGIDTTADGKIIAYVQEGETIFLTPEAYNDLTETDVAEAVTKTTTPTETNKLANTTGAAATTMVSQQNPDTFNMWPLLVAVLSLLALAIFLTSETGKRMLNKMRYGKEVYNPTTGGRAMVEGGIRNAEHASEVLTDGFVSIYNQQNPGNQITAAQTEFIRGQRGASYSDGHLVGVGYWNGRTERRFLTGQDSWEGIVRNLTNGSETRVIALAACGNVTVTDLEHVRFVPNPVQEHVPVSPTNVTTVTASEAQLKAIVKITKNLKEGLGEFSKNGGQISLTVGQTTLEMTLNAPALPNAQKHLAAEATIASPNGHAKTEEKKEEPATA